MKLAIVPTSSHPELAIAVARSLGVPLVAVRSERFPDGEAHVAIADRVAGADAWLVGPTSPPVDAHLVELLVLADACRRAGAARVSALVPYLGYARQDRRGRPGEAVAARVVADVFAAARLARLVAVDLHTPTLEGFFAMPVEHLTATALLAAAIGQGVADDAVIVAPDLGAAKLAERLGRALDRPVAVVHKARVSGELVSAIAISGDVKGRAPVVVDDMITTGATIEAAVRAVRDAGAKPGGTVAATHGLFVAAARERLDALGLDRVIVTDSVPAPPHPPRGFATVGLAELLADALRRLSAGA